MSNSQLNTATTTGEPEVDETPPEYTEIDTPPPAYQETEALPEESSSRTHSDHLHEPPAPPRKSPSSLTRFLHNLAYPLAIILGLFITAGSTYLLVHHIQQLIATAAVDSDQQTWIRAALTQVYEPCYHGCPNCIEPEYAQDACRRTTAGNLDVSNLGGVVCDAYEIWNWTEKYPIVCLNAMGELLKKEALESKKRGYHNLLGLTVLTGLSGVAGGYIVFWMVKEWARKREKRERCYGQDAGRGSDNTARSRRESRMSLRTVLGGLVLYGIQDVKAYACVDKSFTSYDQYFISTNPASPAVRGVIHGWLGDCAKRPTCAPHCSIGIRGITICHQKCSTYTNVVRTPRQYVWDIIPAVTSCGFEMVKEGGKLLEDVRLRVAHPGIESNWWVKISVNGYNVTRPDRTDDQVMCLWALGEGRR